MSRTKLFLLLLITLVPLSCALPSLFSQALSVSVKPSDPILVLAPANATATPTPFMPLPPTPTYIPTSFPTPTAAPTGTPDISVPIAKSWADYPGPSVWPDFDIPAPVGLLPQPNGQVNILLLGSDQRLNEGGFRTDTILLLTINRAMSTANLTSFPRDLYVYIPGYTMQRINTAMAHGGFDSLALTFEYNFGVHPDHYFLINFWSFSQAIDSLGGIDVHVAVPFTDQRDRYGDYHVPAGNVHMDGATALWYVRARYSTNDFDRGRRQQEVLMASFERLLSLDAIQKAPQLFDIYRQNVTTDMTFDQMAPFIPLAAQLSDTSRIHHYYISPREVYDWVTTTGAMVLIPIRDAVLAVMHQALNIP